jgi:hypothetical protein
MDGRLQGSEDDEQRFDESGRDKELSLDDLDRVSGGEDGDPPPPSPNGPIVVNNGGNPPPWNSNPHPNRMM